MVTLPKTTPAPVQSNPYIKPPKTTPAPVQSNPYSNPAPRPMVADYATPSLYQSNAAYNGKPVPGTVGNPNNPTSPTWNQPPYNNPQSNPTPQVTPQVTPQTSATPPAPAQPLTANSTGQFSLAAGASPFSLQQNIQSPTTTGTAAKPPAPKPAGKKPAAKKKPKSSLDKYLGKDSDYQNTIRDLTRALADFKGRQGVEKTRAGTEYGYAQRTMGNQKDQDLGDIQDDAAARGIVTSGVYGSRVGDYNTVYNEQLAELGRQYNSQLQDFASALKDFSRQQDLQKEAARTAAIRRRSAKLGKVS